MMHRSSFYTGAAAVLGIGIFLGARLFTPLQADERFQKLEKIRLPDGFKIALFAQNVPGARSLALGERGTIFIGTRGAGNVYALQDRDGDFKADRRYVVARGLDSPNGVAFHNGALYVAQIGRIVRYDAIESHLDRPPRPVTVSDAFPSQRHHGWKFIRFGPDGRLYVSVGSPCNVCLERDKRFGTIMRMRPDGSGLEIFARGVRNSVGFDWQPATGVLYFTDNGRDMLGNDVPPDELNAASEKGMHFGFPFCHGGTIPDPAFGKENGCKNFTPPAMPLGPHVASLGMRFYTGKQFPASYRNQVFIAEHGSWNRTPPLGYRITLVRFKANRAVSYEVFAEGWLQNGISWGRPVDVMALPDGSLLVSDDKAGAIYRISYQPKEP
jgi:glucose/arabinose dehydrogenase